MIAGFPAREVVVAVMGTIYAVGEEAEEASLTAKLRSAAWPDGRPIFTVPMVLGLLLFYAWCLQCAATIATIRRETNSWRWPLFAWTYMTVIGYTGALSDLPSRQHGLIQAPAPHLQATKYVSPLTLMALIHLFSYIDSHLQILSY